jgi:hypothetical protein
MARFSSDRNNIAVKANMAASTAPTANDDSGDGYSVGSFWYDITADKAYVCLDNTLGSAVWKEITSSSSNIYDEITNTGSIAASGTFTVNLSTGTIVTGDVQKIDVSITDGASDDINIKLYDDDPSGAGELIYEVLSYNPTVSLDDRNVWWLELASVGKLYLQITNNAATSVTLDIHVRIKGD